MERFDEFLNFFYMDSSTILASYTKADLRLNYWRLSMYPVGIILLACACLCFAFLYDRSPAYAGIAIIFLLLLTVWHPHYYDLFSPQSGRFLEYVVSAYIELISIVQSHFSLFSCACT